MGSEHYCLRWNNHQSNLLGVFRELLHDESLVDVTLACSEGASIRAHKVVLSACSSYFRSLFVDHPSRHPIVILKDVRLAELRTLVDFMYKGEVNVEYCQLPALLKTAESLKVKGLAEMTTLSAAGIENRNSSEHLEEEPVSESKDLKESLLQTMDLRERREHKNREKRNEEENRERAERDQRDTRGQWEGREYRENHEQRESREPMREHRKSREQKERDREQREHRERDNRENREIRENRDTKDTRETRERESRDSRESRDIRENPEPSPPPRASPLLAVRRHRHETSLESPTVLHPLLPKDEPPDEPMRSTSPVEETSSTRLNCSQGESIGLNMCINNHGSGAALQSFSPVEQRLSVLNTLPHAPHPALAPHHSQIPSPRHEPIAGPSGLPPVQQVPLSLKKEVDWDRGNEEKCGESSSDFRMHEPEAYEGLGRRGDEMDRLYPCVYCGAAFPHQSKLTRHILSHSLETLKYRESLLGRPLALHHPAVTDAFAPIPPEEAPIDLDIPTSLESGNVVLCKFCGKSFPDVSSLIAHLPVHTGDRPFKCEFCGKAFKLRHHMKDHCRVHTGERPFRCALCGKTFSRSTILKAHEKTHYPKYVRKFLSPSPVDTEEESPHQ